MKIRQDMKTSIPIIENFDISAGKTMRYDISTSNLYFDISKQHYPIHMRYNQSSANCDSRPIRLLVVFRFGGNILQMEYVMSTSIPNVHSESDKTMFT